ANLHGFFLAVAKSPVGVRALAGYVGWVFSRPLSRKCYLPNSSRPACAALIERLEDRRLLSANLDLHISFQPAGLPLASGYVADSGALFGDQGNGVSYGWDADNAKNVRLRKTKVAPDLRYNT